MGYYSQLVVWDGRCDFVDQSSICCNAPDDDHRHRRRDRSTKKKSYVPRDNGYRTLKVVPFLTDEEKETLPPKYLSVSNLTL